MTKTIYNSDELCDILGKHCRVAQTTLFHDWNIPRFNNYEFDHLTHRHTILRVDLHRLIVSHKGGQPIIWLDFYTKEKMECVQQILIKFTEALSRTPKK